MAFLQGITAGTEFAQAGLVSSEYNRLLNSDGAVPANGTAGSMLRLIGIQVANTGFPENESVTVPGDNTSQGSIPFDSEAPNEFLLDFGVFNLSQEATLQGTKVYTFGDFRMGIRRPVNPEYPDCTLIVQGQAKQKDNASGGAAGWYGLIYPRVSLQPLGETALQGRTATAFRYKATAQPATHTPWGFTITEADFGVTQGYAIPFTSLYRLTMQPIAFAGGGGETFNLDFTPASTSVQQNVLVVGSTSYSSGYTISQTAPQLTVATNFSAGTLGTIIYGAKP